MANAGPAVLDIARRKMDKQNDAIILFIYPPMEKRLAICHAGSQATGFSNKDVS
jgi:hypothetical protein